MSNNFNDFMKAGWSYPSSNGGGEYELIESFTVRSSSAIARTESPDGKAYKFDAIIIRFHIPPSMSEQAGVTVTFYDASGNKACAWINAVSGNGSDKYSTVEFFKVGGTWRINAKDFGAVRSVLSCKIDYPTEFVGDYITGIHVGSVVSAGVDVEISGVRA